MKKIFLFVLILAAGSFAGKASAQARADWMPDEGFWQVVSDPHDASHVTIQFFGYHAQLVYQETLEAKGFDPHKRKTRLLLNDCLRNALATCKDHTTVFADLGWVAERMRKNK